MTKSRQRAEWNDPRSVAFRAAVKGWAFSDKARVAAMIKAAKPHAWLPYHHETLEAMQSSIEGNQL